LGQLKTIRVTLRPLRRQKNWLLHKAKAIPSDLVPTYQKGTYPTGCARIVNNALQKMWQTCRQTKHIPLDKQISAVTQKDGVLFLKIQTEYVPIRVKAVDKLDDQLLNNYNSAVVWLKGARWVADIQVTVPVNYVEGYPEAIVGIDLGKFHTCYSIWINGAETYRAFDSCGKTHETLTRIQDEISVAQENFTGSRRELASVLKPLYEKKRAVLRQYYGTLRNRILQHIPVDFNAVFVVEDLDSLPRAELRKSQRTWAHQELANGIFACQIEWNGYKLVKVDPRGTTHTCSQCGVPVKDNGRQRKIFCPTCYPKGLDRDLNGARNIAKRYMLLASHNILAVGTPLDDPYKPCVSKAIIEQKQER
jgi:transposase